MTDMTRADYLHILMLLAIAVVFGFIGWMLAPDTVQYSPIPQTDAHFVFSNYGAMVGAC